MTIVPITSADLEAAEVSFFAALCADDFQYLGVPDSNLKSSWAHCSEIVQRSEKNGFRNILCPSSYQIGQDTLSFVAGCAPITEKINLLAAIRCGEMQPIMLARTIATLDHMLEGRLTINIISSDFPGQTEDAPIAINARARWLRFCARPGPVMKSLIRARFISLTPYQQSQHAPISKMAARYYISGDIPLLREIYARAIAMSI